jgi:hypothetical protein
MTKVGFIAVVLLVTVGASPASAETWTGILTDSMCAKSHEPNIEHAMERSGKRMTAKECTVGCVLRRGQKYVLVSDGKVYQIANQDHAGLAVHAADMVTLVGTLTGETIKVSKIEARQR